MDKSLYRRIIAEMRADGVEELGLFYLGESFLVKWLPEAIRDAKEVGFPYVFLTTNGSLATAKRTAACFNAGLNSLKFSFTTQTKSN
jgi:molybdenum cofactor biosynthesis enzyme MoaA